MTAPADRFAAAKRKTAERSTPLNGFRDRYPFELDDFQVPVSYTHLTLPTTPYV